MNISSEILKKISDKAPEYFNRSTVRNVFWFSGGIILFISGVILYGVILNIKEISLDESLKLKGIKKIEHPVLLIERKNYSLSLFEDTILIKTYRANFGRNVNTPKYKADDESTPIGEYFICSYDSVHKYHKFLMINYPNLEDAAEGLRKGLITQKEYDKIRYDFYFGSCPTIRTALGSNMGIHGIGEYNSIFKNLPFVFNWTTGSIAVTNEDIDEIYSVVKKGTKVVIK